VSYLVVEELYDTLEQEFFVNLDRRYSLKAIRPLLFMYNAPSGTFTLSIKQGANVLSSVSFDSAEIKSDLNTTANYAYLWKTLVFSNPIQLSKGAYTIELSSSSYSFSTFSYIGWIKEHENIFNDTVPLNADDFDNPLSFQLFEFKRANYD
jgi:hypothetical protein